jgi:hypothetical protein
MAALFGRCSEAVTICLIRTLAETVVHICIEAVIARHLNCISCGKSGRYTDAVIIFLTGSLVETVVDIQTLSSSP